ncbi:hypothetical protein PRK78_001832 [Emydomyces testavorans]|uniref:NWD NACHT-NTPase N-terminal domain-containing protein n=1 Tax=Emydomyces testavorans TaxID=2070801 RepID=A0AAF0DDY9_9EURO|nr:hypothetical protein PRK78_001832 [Emydomyces testavorans]
MPMRNRIRRFLGEAGIRPSRSPSPSISSNIAPTPRAPANSQPLQLQGLWKEAYEQLRKEDTKLIGAYENALLQEGQPAQAGLRYGSDPDPRLRALVDDRLQEIEDCRLKLTVAGKEIVVRDQVNRAIQLILSVKDVIGAAVSSEPHGSLAWAGALVLINLLANSFTQNEAAMNGFEKVSKLMVRYRLAESTHIEIFSKPSGPGMTLPLEEIAASIRAQAVKLYTAILKFQMRLVKYLAHSGFSRFMRDVAVTDNWKDMLKEITNLDEDIHDDLRGVRDFTMREIENNVEKLQEQMSTSLSLMSKVRDDTKAIKHAHLLDSLPFASGAEFDSYEDQHKSMCLEGTQVKTLHRIQAWAESPGKENIYWLKGMAGTGKSTISRTFAAACRDRKSLVDGTPMPNNICLGASFFFDQTKPHRNSFRRLFTTISRQLAETSPEIRDEICKSISSHPNVRKGSLNNQWNHLILQPLLSLEKGSLLPLTLVLVIDALDECEPEECHLSILFELIKQTQQLGTIRLRLFITSRPEVHILKSFHAILKGIVHEDELHKISIIAPADRNGLKDDITKFVEHELAKIARSHNLAAGWPGETKIRELACKADGLFIFAATACRFLAGARLTKSRIEVRLNMVFDGRVTESSPQESLDGIYSRILQFSLIGNAVDEEKDEIYSMFKLIVGSIILLIEPLSTSALSSLLSSSRSTIEETLEALSSLLSMGTTETSTVQLLHLSFRDFLLDQQRCKSEGFWIAQEPGHSNLLQNCLAVLSDVLRQDICGFDDPSVLAADVERSRVNQYLPAHAQYACLYWVDHLQRAKIEPCDDDGVSDFLNEHFLHWLEALSLIGKISEGVHMLQALSNHICSLPGEGRTKLLELVHDAGRFVLKFKSLIETAPLQVYSSALVHCPEVSIVRKRFQNKIPKSISRLPVIETEWSSLLQTLVDSGAVRAVALSPDGKLVASSAVCVWDVATGTLLQTLEPLDEGQAVAFSTDGKLVMSLSHKGHLRVWDVVSGLLIQDVQSSLKTCHNIYRGLFSHDRKLAVAYASLDMELFDVTNGRTRKTFGDILKRISTVAFSPDGKLLAVGFGHGSMGISPVQLWDTNTGALQYELPFHPEAVSSVKFSLHDGRVLASMSSGCIRLWDLVNRKALSEIQEHFDEIEFSPRNRVLLSRGFRGVRLWDWESGELLKTIDDKGVTFRVSNDGKLLACLNIADRKINVWDATTGTLLSSLGHHSDVVCDASFSEDNKLLASASDGCTVRLWNIETPFQSVRSKSHSEPVDMIVLLPNHGIAVSRSAENTCLWDVKTGALQQTIRSVSKKPPLISSDGRWFINPKTKDIEVWETATGELVRSFKHHSAATAMWALSPNGKYLAHSFDDGFMFSYSGAFGGYIHGVHTNEDAVKLFEWRKQGPRDRSVEVAIWDLYTGKLLHVIKGKTGFVSALAFSPDSERLAFGPHCDMNLSASDEAQIVVWDLARAELCMPNVHLTDSIHQIAWSPDGTMLACASSSPRTLQLWNSTTGASAILLEESCRVPTIAFSPDGKLLAAGCDDGRVRLWEVNTGSMIGHCEIARRSLQCLSFSNDGRLINTVLGRFDVRSFYAGCKSTTSQNLFVEGSWIVNGKGKFLLSPYEYRVQCAAATNDNVLILGHQSGHVTFLELEVEDEET